jgi:hypothetical protein
VSTAGRRAALREACRVVLAATVALSEFHDRWGEFENSGSTFERTVFEDLVYASSTRRGTSSGVR